MRRNNIEIENDILAIAIKGARKTAIVYQANLNFVLVHRYLGSLIARGLLSAEEKIYVTTNRGLHYMRQIAELKAF